MSGYLPEETINLLGQKVYVTKTRFKTYVGITMKVPEVNKGDQGIVKYIGVEDGKVVLLLLINNDLVEFNKDSFERHCQLEKNAWSIDYASLGRTSQSTPA